MTLFATFAAAGQSDAVTFPYNPDIEPDGYIGINDLLGFLPHFASEFDVDSANWVGQLLEQSEALSTEVEALSDSLTNVLTTNDDLIEAVDSLSQYPDSLSWALNRDACKVSMSPGWSYEVGINCQYVFVAIPNSGGWGSDTFLRLPEEVPFEDYSVHVHVNKSGVIACGTNGTGCPQVYVQVHQDSGWQLFDVINPNDFNSGSGLAVQHRTYVWSGGSWTTIEDNYVNVQGTYN